MNAPATVTPMPTPAVGSKLGFNQVMARGRIEASRKHGTSRYTRCICPAPDEYSRPQTIEIRSKAKLGEVDEVVTVHCKLGGYARRPFRSVDKETGESTMVTPIDMTLDAVE